MLAPAMASQSSSCMKPFILDVAHMLADERVLATFTALVEMQHHLLSVQLSRSAPRVAVKAFLAALKAARPAKLKV
jgi:hypothetical protein